MLSYITGFILTFWHRNLRDAIHLSTLRWSHSLTFGFLQLNLDLLSVSYASLTDCMRIIHALSLPPNNKDGLSINDFKISDCFRTICIILFCKLRWSFWTLLVQTEFNSSKVLTLHNNFGLEPTAECMWNKTKSSCVQNTFSVHYNKVALGATEVLMKNEWTEKQQCQQNCKNYYVRIRPAAKICSKPNPTGRSIVQLEVQHAEDRRHAALQTHQKSSDGK